MNFISFLLYNRYFQLNDLKLLAGRVSIISYSLKIRYIFLYCQKEYDIFSYNNFRIDIRGNLTQSDRFLS